MTRDPAATRAPIAYHRWEPGYSAMRELDQAVRGSGLEHSVQELIKEANRTNEIKDYIEKSRELYGTQSFDQHLIDLYQAGIITLETAKTAATNAADLERALYVN